MSERASTKGRDDELASASNRPEPSSVGALVEELVRAVSLRCYSHPGPERRSAVERAETATQALHNALKAQARDLKEAQGYAQLAAAGWEMEKARLKAAESERDRLRAALEGLLKQSREVERLGAQTGSQWIRLGSAIIGAKCALAASALENRDQALADANSKNPISEGRERS